MTSIINNSNANSALVNTLESSDSMTNPNVYSTKEIYPTSAMTYTDCQKSNGSSGPSETMNFNLNKYGIIEQILFNYTKQSAAANSSVAAGDIFNVIEKVELLSSSRVISILTSADLRAQWSNLNSSQYEPIRRTAVAARTAVATSKDHDYVFPLTFGFMTDINTQLNSSFLEPLSIRVTYGVNLYDFKTGHAATGASIINTFLTIRYKSYPEAPTAQILASNYSAPELVQVSTRFYDENPITVGSTTATSNPNLVVDIDLRNTDCVQDFYIFVCEQIAADTTSTPTRAAHLGPPLPISKVVFTGSGQQILSLSQAGMAYSRLTENGFSSSSATGIDGALDISAMRNVVKIQNGLYEHSGGGPLSNTMSLREINAGRISITFNYVATGSTSSGIYTVQCVENCSAIYSTSSAVGRLSLALSN